MGEKEKEALSGERRWWWFGHVSGARAADNGRSLGRHGHSRGYIDLTYRVRELEGT